MRCAGSLGDPQRAESSDVYHSFTPRKRAVSAPSSRDGIRHLSPDHRQYERQTGSLVSYLEEDADLWKDFDQGQKQRFCLHAFSESKHWRKFTGFSLRHGGHITDSGASAGVFTKPSILAHPSSLVHAGARVSLRCHSELAFDEFVLYKEGHTQYSQQYGKMIQAGHHSFKAVFSVGPITPAHAGACRCCGCFSHSRYVWSAPSDPLDIVITGKYKKPSLITHENAMVDPGDTVTLFCSSEIPFDKYHLSRKQEAGGHWLSGGQSHSGTFQVNLPLCLVSPTSSGSYRCYGSFNESPYEWSAPSNPLHVSVTGIPESTCLTTTESTPETDENTTYSSPAVKERWNQRWGIFSSDRRHAERFACGSASLSASPEAPEVRQSEGKMTDEHNALGSMGQGWKQPPPLGKASIS
ncbi:killer cell immunoglobulin-like receptor 2DS2 [Symphalangus syndactylus]|uniref:killer cell immunoglobulin-like receptor 2DS2 n=1 Tax=Symphalangus syndactylus TaxID=9590 RepID=UPI002441A144|nr:killer cell immunoglobulin-like receptor 2DS2 [Symphalangus syndactylus]